MTDQLTSTSNIDAAADFYDGHALTLFDQISVLFSLRQNRAKQRLSTLETLPQIDRQIQKALDYLAMHRFVVEQLTRELLANAEQNDIGSEAETYAAALVAFQSGDHIWIERVVNGFVSFGKYRDGLAYALAWLPKNISDAWIVAFLRSKYLKHKYLGVKVCSLLRHYPQSAIHGLLSRDDCRQDLALYRELLFIAGQMKDAKLIPLLVKACSHEDEHIKTTALWSRLVLHDNGAVNDAMSHSLTSDASFYQLSPWLIRVMSMSESKYYLSLAFQNPQISMDIKILAVADHGDPAVLTWLFQTLTAPCLMPWLGFAFHQVTGLDIVSSPLDLVIADEDQIEVLLEGSEEDVAVFLDEDLSLPYPNREKLIAAWATMQSGFLHQQRYFEGQLVDPTEAKLTQPKLSDHSFVRVNSDMIKTLFDHIAHFSLFVAPQGRG